MKRRKTGPRDLCVCGHERDRHETAKPHACMKVDLNAGGRFVHGFCSCPTFRPAAPEKE